MKAGWKTTEFYVALIGSILMVGVTAGFWTSAEVQAFVDALSELAQAVAVVVTAGGPIFAAAVMVWKYITSRTELKRTDRINK